MIVQMSSTSPTKIIAISFLPIISHSLIFEYISSAVKLSSSFQWEESPTSVLEQEITLPLWQEHFETTVRILGLVLSKAGYSLRQCKSLRLLVKPPKATIAQLPQETYTLLPELRYIHLISELSSVG